MRSLRLSRSAFDAWLERHADDHVGYTGSPACCPLANFLHDRGDASALVGPVWVKHGPGGRSTLLPPWASEFVLRLDRAVRGTVTGRQALDLLRTGKP